jgi:hypothetical protein
MSESTEPQHDEEGTQEESEERQQAPVDNEQRAALQTGGGKLDEQQSEVGEGVLDHAEHSDAPGPFGTS